MKDLFDVSCGSCDNTYFIFGFGEREMFALLCLQFLTLISSNTFDMNLSALLIGYSFEALIRRP